MYCLKIVFREETMTFPSNWMFKCTCL